MHSSSLSKSASSLPTMQLWTADSSVGHLGVSLKQRLAVGYRGPVNSLFSNSTPPDFFLNLFCLAPTNADSGDITWGNLSDLTQLPLETHAVVLPNNCEQTVMCKISELLLNIWKWWLRCPQWYYQMTHSCSITQTSQTKTNELEATESIFTWTVLSSE